jgi:hypothetical protein
MERDYVFQSQIIQIDLLNSELPPSSLLFKNSKFKSQKNNGGFSRSRFLEEPPKEFLCGLCTNFVKKPTECSKCGQLYCEVCINELKHKTEKRRFECLVCTCPKEPRTPSLILKKMIGESKIFCLFTNKGCLEVVDLDSLAKHEIKCPFKEVVCENLQYCRKSGMIKDFVEIEDMFPNLHAALSGNGMIKHKGFVCSERCKHILAFQRMVFTKQHGKALKEYFELMTSNEMRE